jgi:hypothetical protein
LKEEKQMIQVRNVIRIAYDADGNLQHVVDLDVSTAAELPDMGDVIGGGKVLPTSTANIIQTGAWARLDEDGKWYAADGSGEVTAEAASSLSAPLTLGKTVKPAVIEPESFEPDELKEQEIEEEETEPEPTESEVVEDER